MSGRAQVVDRYAGRKVLVTGATGLLGSALTRRLVDAGSDVVVLVLDGDARSELVRSGTIRRVTVVNGDVRDFTAVERAVADGGGVDTVFHLAAQAIVETGRRMPVATFETNVSGTWNVMEACRLHRDLIRSVVVASSDKAYGDHGSETYLESTQLDAREPYETSKACADLIARSYASSYGVPAGIARCGNIFGGGDLNWSRLVPGALASLLMGERLVVRSTGHLQRDYLYVEDVVDAYLLLGDAINAVADPGASFNFGGSHPMSVLEMYAAVAKAVGRPDLEPVVLGTAVGEIGFQHLCSERAETVLGWRAQWELDGALTATAEWYRGYFADVGTLR